MPSSDMLFPKKSGEHGRPISRYSGGRFKGEAEEFKALINAGRGELGSGKKVGK